MYKFIEDMYKKKSPYNRIKKWTFGIYSIFVIISLVFNFYSKVIPMIFVFLLMVVVMKIVCEIILKTKLCINIWKKNNVGDTLPYIIRNKEHEMFKDYSIKNNLYNEKSLLCIIEHYRSLIKPKIVGGNLLAILSIALPLLLSFYSKDGFDFKSLATALPYILSFIIIIIILYFSYNQFIEAKKFLKGEDGMAERLEEIFSELYIECVNNLVVDKNH